MNSLLIVDDEEDVRIVIKDALAELNIQFDEASDGEEALQLISKKNYDAILSDINMPRMNGIELLRLVRNKGYSTPFVILTAHGDKNLAVQALRLGAFDFIDKPWDPADLVAVISKAMELGAELLRWGGFDDQVKDLNQFQANSATESERRLGKSIQLLTAANHGLRKKIEGKE